MRGQPRSRLISFALFSWGLIFLSSPAVKAEDLKEVTRLESLDFEAAGKLTRIQIKTTGKAEFVRPYSLKTPKRLIINLQNMAINETGLAGDGLGGVDRYILVPEGKNKGRLILDLNTPLAFARLLELPAIDGDSLNYLIDFIPVSEAVFLQNAEKDAEKLIDLAADRLPKAPPLTSARSRPLVVIDPGHGGKDSGSNISGRKPEKDIVLAVAKELKRRLILSREVDVLLTREDDTFIGLKERITLAQHHGADLFLSLHVDINDDPNVHGASIYTLSDKASDQLAQAAAARENQNQELEAIGLKGDDQALMSDFLFDMMKRETRSFSESFADILLIALQSTADLVSNPRRAARFYILTAPDIPSTLVEIGFISNPLDAERMESARWQASLAEALTVATLDYFARLK